MAFKLSTDAQLVFFSTVFGATHAVASYAKDLLKAGVKFEVGLYSLTAHLTNGATSSMALTVGSTSLMKGTPDVVVTTQNKKLIVEWLVKVKDLQGSIKPIPGSVPIAPPKPVKKTLMILGFDSVTDTIPNVLLLTKAISKILTTIPLAEAKAMAQQAIAGQDVFLGIYSAAEVVGNLSVLQAAGAKTKLVPEGFVPEPFAPMSSFDVKVKPSSVKPALVPEVIDLKAAQAVGQKVHGTSKGSVYYCIAVSEQGVKVAARVYQGGSISIRAEWIVGEHAPPASTISAVQSELKKLEESGLQMKPSGYGSIHFDASGVPLQRVIGAFLVGTGIKWKDSVTNGGDVVITAGD